MKGLMLAATVLALQDEAAEREKNAKEAAEAWFHALIGGDVPAAMKRSGVPFAWDGKTLVETEDELRNKCDEVVADKGKREVKIDKAEIVSDKKETVEECVPDDRIVVKLTAAEGSISVCVRPGKTYVVIGFKD